MCVFDSSCGERVQEGRWPTQSGSPFRNNVDSIIRCWILSGGGTHMGMGIDMDCVCVCVRVYVCQSIENLNFSFLNWKFLQN